MAPDTIRIETKGSLHPRDWRVFLNDQDISRFVAGVEVRGNVVDPAATVHLTLLGALELPDELKALVHTTVVPMPAEFGQ